MNCLHGACGETTRARGGCCQPDVVDPVDALRELGGLVVLRFTWADVMFTPDQVAEAIEDVVRWRTRQAVGRHALVA